MSDRQKEFEDNIKRFLTKSREEAYQALPKKQKIAYWISVGIGLGAIVVVYLYVFFAK